MEASSPSNHLDAAIEKILDDIETKIKDGEDEMKQLVTEIKEENKNSDAKGKVILKQLLGNVLTDMENMDSEPSTYVSRLRRAMSGWLSRSSPNAGPKKVMEDLDRAARKQKYLNEERKKLVDEGEAEEDLELVGREKEKEKIIDQLVLLSQRRIKDETSPIPVITISGLAGIGKTKLARHVCQDDKVLKQVGFPAWVAKSETLTFDAIPKHVIDSMLQDTRASPSPTTKILNIIVILDDWRVEIEDENVETLQKKINEHWGDATALQKKFKKARPLITAIMITTRNYLVAMGQKIVASPVKSYALAGLNEKESATLFEKTPGRGAGDNSSVTEILGQCRGIPRAIITMAKFLHSPCSQLTELTAEEELVYSCYDEGLPYFCFAYFSLFPQDYVFDAERLIHLWMAEGIGSVESDGECSVESGRECLRDLIGRSIFHNVRVDEFGQVKSFRLHPLMHDMARFVARREDIIVDPNGLKVHSNVLRASFDLSLDFSRGLPAPLLDKAKQLTSILFFAKTKSLQVEMITPILESIFKSFKSICVLDLRDLGIVAVPSSIGELKTLKYLDLSQNNMEKLPSSIVKLSNLETLKLSRCYLLQELPKNFENLSQLKHLDIEGCLGLTRMPQKMSNLQTLSTFVANNNDPAGGLKELANLKDLKGHLQILHLDRVKPFDEMPMLLEDKLRHVKGLTLKWDLGVKEKRGTDDLKLLDRLEPHSALKVLILVGYGGSYLPTWLTSTTTQFNNLVKLSLQDCHGCKYISQKDTLPQQLKTLELLRLDNLEYIVKMCDAKSVFYESLKELTISDCPKLKRWWKEEKGINDKPFFRSISKLRVYYCPILTCMPLYPRPDFSSSFGKEVVLVGTSLSLLLETLQRNAVGNFPNNSIPLENLHIQHCNDSKNLCDAFSHLSSLQRLTIEDCTEVILDGPSNEWKGLENLRFLTIRDTPILKSLSFGDSVTNLRELTLHNCQALTSISDNIGNLTSLRRLLIYNCNNLALLPKTMRDLKSLKTLLILDCALLLPRCQRDTGKDWPKIQHIPNIQVT